MDLAADERAEAGREVAREAPAADDEAEDLTLRLLDAPAGDERGRRDHHLDVVPPRCFWSWRGPRGRAVRRRRSPSPACAPPGRAAGTGTAVAQQGERVVPGMVAVAPRSVRGRTGRPAGRRRGGSARPSSTGRESSQPGRPASPRQNAHGQSQRRAVVPYSVWWPSAQSMARVPAARSAWMRGRCPFWRRSVAHPKSVRDGGRDAVRDRRGHRHPDRRPEGSPADRGYPARMSLVIDGLHKRFGDVVALDGIGFRVEPGEVFGFLGANGAGKTTTMRIVLGILEADAGTVTVERPADAPSCRAARGATCPEERGLYSRMTVLDQLVYFAGLYGVDRRTARHEVHAWLERFRVPEFADRRAEQLSKGNQQKVQFIAAILHDPDVLIMDEPFTGLDPVNAALLKEAFIEMRDRGKTLIFSTHQMEPRRGAGRLDRDRRPRAGSSSAVRLADIKRASGQADRSASRSPATPTSAGSRGCPVSTVIRTGLDYAEVELDEGADPQAILAAAREHGPVTRFELADPSVEAIFIEHVGRRPDEDERHLAAVRVRGNRRGHRRRRRRRRARCQRRPIARQSGPAGRGRSMSIFPNAWLVARREYLGRVRSRAFVISTRRPGGRPRPPRASLRSPLAVGRADEPGEDGHRRQGDGHGHRPGRRRELDPRHLRLVGRRPAAVHRRVALGRRRRHRRSSSPGRSGR